MCDKNKAASYQKIYIYIFFFVVFFCFFVVANQTYNLQIIEEQGFQTSIYQTFIPPISPQNYT